MVDAGLPPAVAHMSAQAVTLFADGDSDWVTDHASASAVVSRQRRLIGVGCLGLRSSAVPHDRRWTAVACLSSADMRYRRGRRSPTARVAVSVRRAR